MLCTLAWLLIIILTTAIVTEIDGGEATSETGLLLFIVGQGLAGLIGWFALPLLIMRRRDQRGIVAWRKPTSTDVVWAVGGLITIYAVLFVYTLIVTSVGADSLEPQSTIDDDRLFTHTSVMIALAVLVVVCAPIYEEAFAAVSSWVDCVRTGG